jgi:hypothetical protein
MNPPIDDESDDLEETEITKEVEDDSEFHEFDKVKLNAHAEENRRTVTGSVIPSFAFRNQYLVSKILGDRVIIKAGTLMLAVTKEDITKIQ